MAEDFRALAQRLPRAEFASRHPFYFLVGIEELTKPRPRASTMSFEVLQAPAETKTRELSAAELPFDDGGTAPLLLPENLDDDDEKTPVRGLSGASEPTLLMLAVRKITASDPDRVTVGRSSSRDIEIPDSDISRLHAFFRLQSDHVMLGDLGSSNGTMVNGKLLEPNGPLQMILPGDRIRFAVLEFEFLDAADAWDRVHRLSKGR